MNKYFKSRIVRPSPGYDYILFYSIFLLAILSVYALPEISSILLFGSLLVLFIFSKKDYFWFALIFAFIDSPGGFFPFGDLNYGIPMLSYPALISYQEIFIYAAFIKAVIRKSNNRNVYNKSLIALLVYFLFLIFITPLLGSSMHTILKTIKWVLPWTLVYSIPRLIRSESDWTRFFGLIFTFQIVAFASQIVELALGRPPALLLGTDFESISGEVVNEQNNWVLYNRAFDVYRLLGSYFIGLISFIGSMFYLASSLKTFKRTYLILILIISVTSIFLSATRGFIIAFFLGLLIYMLVIISNFKYTARLAFLGILIFFALTQVPFIQKQFAGVVSRIETTTAVFEGDFSAEGTNKRITEYTPTLLNYFYESPIFGWGFSDTFWDINNGHAGMPNLLANAGVIGMLIFMYFWWELFYIPIRTMRKLPSVHPYKRSLMVLSIGVIMLLVIHSLSGQLFQYLIGYYNTSFAVLIFISFSNFAVKNANMLHILLLQDSLNNKPVKLNKQQTIN